MQVYTDGSCYPNDGTGPGGWAYATMTEDGLFLCCGHICKPTTNNIAELSAVIAAIMDDNDSHVFSDSEYVVKGFNTWMTGWKKKGWKKKKGALKNVAFWKKLSELKEDFNGKVSWVRGHNGTFLNELADAGANYARIVAPEKPVNFSMGLVEAQEFAAKYSGRDRPFRVN